MNFTAPLFGPRMWAGKGEAGQLEQEVFASSPVTMAHFEKARVEGTRRIGRLLIPDLSVVVRESTVTASFTLTKGAFATIVMRELMKVDEGHLSVVREDDE
ncbi:MAG: tRNA pseudouridine(13) synthase TruD [Caldilinea sp.]